MAQAIALFKDESPSFTERFYAHLLQWIWSARLDYQLYLWNAAGNPNRFPPESFVTPWDDLAAKAGTSEIDEWQHPLVKPLRRRIIFDFKYCIYRFNFQHYHFELQPDDTYSLRPGEGMVY